MPYFQISKEGRDLLKFPVTSPQMKIGRHGDNDITLPDEDVSRFHAMVQWDGVEYRLIDQGRNGTLKNGRRIDDASLQEGDEIVIGSWKLVWHALDPEESLEEKETVLRRPGQSKIPSLFSGMVGTSEVMKRVFSLIDRVAPTEMTVLILGETGAGKELVASAIHERSPRERKPFVALNCGAISPQLIESELFGHERGAFTGALQRHAGVFEQAQGGTLFLDEVGELPLELQPKLLRVLEERKFRRVGGTQDIEANVRIVAATHRQLEAWTREGKFREDLFYRLYQVPIVLPPLRERQEDIPLLAQFFLEMLQRTNRIRDPKVLSEAALEKMKSHVWRGNVRELKNVITRAILFAESAEIKTQDLSFLSDTSSSAQFKPSLANAEKEAIVNALRQTEGNKTKAAEVLGIAKSTLFNKLKEYQIGDS